MAGYTAAKGGVIGMTRNLAAEWGSRGVRVNALCPGYFPTEMTEGFDAPGRDQAHRAPHAAWPRAAPGRARRRPAVPGLGCLELHDGADARGRWWLDRLVDGGRGQINDRSMICWRYGYHRHLHRSLHRAPARLRPHRRRARRRCLARGPSRPRPQRPRTAARADSNSNGRLRRSISPSVSASRRPAWHANWRRSSAGAWSGASRIPTTPASRCRADGRRRPHRRRHAAHRRGGRDPRARQALERRRAGACLRAPAARPRLIAPVRT